MTRNHRAVAAIVGALLCLLAGPQDPQLRAEPLRAEVVQPVDPVHVKITGDIRLASGPANTIPSEPPMWQSRFAASLAPLRLPAAGSCDPFDANLPTGTLGTMARPNSPWLKFARGDRVSTSIAVIAVMSSLFVSVPACMIYGLFDERRRQAAKLRERESELQILSRRLALALDASKLGVWELDIAKGELFWDKRMNELYGYPPEDGFYSYEHWSRKLAPEDLERAEREFAIAMRANSRYESQFRVILDDGQTRVIRAMGNFYTGPDSSTRIVGINGDATADVELTEALTRSKALTEARNSELEAARARLEHNSQHDFLTRLPNRMYLERILDAHAARCAASGEGIVLLHADLDRFKQINDTLGHSAGDAMLVHAAELIRANLREGDFVARTGGDEFVIACPAKYDMTGFDGLAARLIAATQKPVIYDGYECRLGMSIGIAGAFGTAVDARRLLVNADIALYRAKSLGRDRYEFFTPELQAEIVRAKKTADSILCGLESGEFIPYYQPQFDARTLDMVGVEALVRWRHPVRGILPPNEFLDIAGELNVLSSIDRVVLEQGLAQFRRWQQQGFAVPRISVNVSLRRLRDENLLESLRKLDIQPGTLSFELVESIYLDESDEAFTTTIDQIKSLGIDVEIDDFGTGYASIVSLTKLKPRRLKIDRQLVTPIVHSQAQRRLVCSIVEIGKSLDIEIAAEGVETMEHARMLRDLGCDILQGYVFARPMAASELEQFLANRRRLAS